MGTSGNAFFVSDCTEQYCVSKEGGRKRVRDNAFLTNSDSHACSRFFVAESVREWGSETKKKTIERLLFHCGATGNRTRDTRIFSPLLYQLSYGTPLFFRLRMQRYVKYSNLQNFPIKIVEFNKS